MSTRHLCAGAAAAALAALALAGGTTATPSQLPTDPAALATTLSCAKVTAASGRQLCIRLATALANYNSATNGWAAAVTRLGTAGDTLLAVTKQMQETQMSFNLQYLQLQTAMQNENRQYTAVSNIMKTKHDTVKNSISNIK